MTLALRLTLVTAAALGTTACANEPTTGSFAPMMMVNAPARTADATPAVSVAQAPSDDLSRKSFAAKVLASRALESVTGLKADPARLSEHD